MSSRTIASSGLSRSKVISAQRRRNMGKAVFTAVEYLERRVLMTFPLPRIVAYGFEGADGTDPEGDSTWLSGSITQANGSFDSSSHFDKSSSNAITLTLHGSPGSPLPTDRMLSIQGSLYTFNSTARGSLDLSFSNATIDPDAAKQFPASLDDQQQTGHDILHASGSAADDYTYAYSFEFKASSTSTASVTFTVSGMSNGATLGLDRILVMAGDPVQEAGCPCPKTVVSTGAVKTTTPVLYSTLGGASDFGDTLTMGNSGLAAAADGSAGNNILVNPVLIQLGYKTLGVVNDANTVSTFDDPDGDGIYTERFGLTQTLATDTSSHQFLVRADDGTVTHFNDFSTNTASIVRGKLASIVDPNGNVTTYNYNGTTGYPDSIERTEGSSTTTFLYGYFGTNSANSGKLQSVTQESPGTSGTTAVRSFRYDYYDNSGTGINAYGELGDLMSVKVLAGSATSGATIDATYYRYWMAADSDFGTNGYTGALKMILGPASYDRAVASGYDPLASAVSGSNLATFADSYFTYDPTTQRVKSLTSQGEGCSTCSGGFGTYTYSYKQSGVATGSNFWQDKTTTVLPDNNQQVDYFNADGQPLLSVFQQLDTSQSITLSRSSTTATATTSSAHGYSPGDVVVIRGASDAYYNGTFTILTTPSGTTFTYAMSGTPAGSDSGSTRKVTGQLGQVYRYNDSGLLLLQAEPSAVNLPANLSDLDAYPDLLNKSGGTVDLIRNSDGLIHETTYYSSTTAADPDAAGSAGGVANFVHQTFLYHGESDASPALQSTFDYYKHDNGGMGANLVTIYPVASVDVYRNTGASGTQTTTYSRTWYANSLQMKTEQVLRPAIGTDQNGNGSVESDTTYFDTFGRPIWTTDNDADVGYISYDPISGAVLKTIVDVNYASLSGGEQTSFNLTGWDSPIGLNLVTVTNSDALGRTTKITDPNENATAGTGNVTYVVYNDTNHEVRVYPGFDGTNTTGPIQITREDRAGSFTESLTLAATPHLTNNVPDGTESYTGTNVVNIRTLSRTHISDGGQIDESDRFFDFGGISTYLSGTGATNLHMGGTAGTSYYATTYGYDNRGRENKVVNPLGTITRTVYDGLGRTTSLWSGTSDASWSPTNAASMTKLADYLYDTYDPAIFVAGDSNLTRVTTYPSGTNAARTDDSYFDWRNRLVATKSGVLLNGSSQEDYAAETNSASVQRMINYMEYDNLDETTAVNQYDGDGVQMLDGNAPKDNTTAGVPDAPGTNTLRARMTQDYDDQGRVWQTKVFSVDQTTGNIGNSLKSWSWYDHRGNLIKSASPGGLVTKYTYDGAGRVIKQYTTNGGGDAAPAVSGSWDNAGTVTGDNVLEQTEFQYDANSNVIFSIHKLHYHNDSNTGELNSASSTPKAEVMYNAFYYDRINRPTATVDHGTNGGVSLSAPPAAVTGRSAVTGTTTSGSSNNSTLIDTSRTEPTGYWIGATLKFTSGSLINQTRTITGWDLSTHTFTYTGTTGSNPANGVTYSLTPNALVTTYDYNDSGWQATATDPRGIAAKTFYDLAGRTTKTIANYVDGIANNGADDQITQYNYNGNDNILTMKAVLNNTGTNSIFQTTEYVYGVVAGTNVTDSDITSNDLLASIKYPDTLSGDASNYAANIEAFAYNALGEQKTLSDRNGNIHQYARDVLGRLTSDSVTTLGSGVNGSVLRIDYNFDTTGRPYQMTSYSNTAGTGTPVNQLQYAYNGYGQMTIEYQAHGGAVNTGSSPKVQYAFNEGGDHDDATNNNSRLKSITYPNGRIVRYEYGTGGGIDDDISRVAYLADDAAGSVGTHLEEYDYLGLSTLVSRTRPDANSSMTLYHSGSYTGLDRFNRIVSQSWTKTSDSTTLDGFEYAYDKASNLLYKRNLVSSTFSELYHLNGATNGTDGLNRLTDMRRGTLSDANSDGVYDTVSSINSLSGSQKAWSLDAVGNWNSSTSGTNVANRTTNMQNQVTSITGATSPAYDNAGNVTTDDAGKTLTYDAWNRMISYKNGGSTLQTFSYDAAGRRATENSGTSTDLYYSAAWQVLEERDSGIAKRQNVFSPFYVDDLIERDRDVDGSLDGAVDTTFGDATGTTGFGSTGRTTTDFNSGNVDTARAVVIQPDGKTVVAGYTKNGSNAYDFAVARYDINGSLDASFGTGGKVTIDFGTTDDLAYALALQSDGDILVAGGRGNTGHTGFRLARLTSSGNLDCSFDSDGKVTTSFGTGNDTAVATSVAVQSDGKIVLGGYANLSGHDYFAAARYNSNGSLDTSFSTDGQVTFSDFSVGADSEAYAMAIDANGKIVLGGVNGGDLALGRFNADGSQDTSFDSDGFATTSIAGTQQVNGLVIQPDGKIVVGGSSGTDFILARFTDTGSLDTTSSFGTSGGGYITTNFTGTDAAYALARQADGKFVAAGVSNSGDFAIARYDANGTLDSGFNSTGKVTTDFGGTDTAYALAIGPDYKITVAGQSGDDFAVARYKVANGLEERMYVLSDLNHNVTGVTDVFGVVQERFVYDPYGASTVLTSAWGTTSDSLSWTYRDQGLRYDSTTNTQDNRNRVYMITLGRFAQPDPSGYPDGVNRYQNRLSNPLRFLDPEGLAPITTLPPLVPDPPLIPPPPPTSNLIPDILTDYDRHRWHPGTWTNEDWDIFWRRRRWDELLCARQMRQMETLLRERRILELNLIAAHQEVLRLIKQPNRLDQPTAADVDALKANLDALQKLVAINQQIANTVVCRPGPYRPGPYARTKYDIEEAGVEHQSEIQVHQWEDEPFFRWKNPFSNDP